jgi:hypothetical protein
MSIPVSALLKVQYKNVLTATFSAGRVFNSYNKLNY